MESSEQTASEDSSVVTPSPNNIKTMSTDAEENPGGERVDVPKEHDVLCGRGGSINSHIGNEFFRQLVEKRKRVYLTARFKREKRLIASSIVSDIRSKGGRFLARKGGKDGYWEDIGDEKARDKTSQALRENAPSIRAEIETEINEQRKEMQLQEEEQQYPPPAAAYPPPPAGAHPPPPPPQHAYYQNYWDYYYHYYGGYPPPPPGAHPPPPPHAVAPYAPGHTPPPPISPNAAASSHPPPLPPGYTAPPAHWGRSASKKSLEESKSSGDDCSMSSQQQHLHQEEEDLALARELQHQENQEAYDARKRRHDSSNSRRMSSAFLPGIPPPSNWMNHKHAKHDGSSPFEKPRALTQEEKDHKMAVQLQEQEDANIRRRQESIQDTSRRTSRSNCLSQVQRVMPYHHHQAHHPTQQAQASDAQQQQQQQQQPPSTFEQMVGFTWSNNNTKEAAAPPKDQRKSVQWKEDSLNTLSSTNILPSARDRDMAYSPINLPDDSISSVNTPLLNAMDQSGSLLSQASKYILGTMGSFDVSGTLTNTFASTEGNENQNMTGYHRARTAPQQKEEQPPPQAARHNMETSEMGQEVQLVDDDRHDQSSMMPPPEPRAQIDWPSKVGSCHSWAFAETMTGANSFFSSNQRPGISPVHSLEMDASAHSGKISVGGGSLCQVFNGNNMDEEAYMRMALREVPSWEHSMRSKSPTVSLCGDSVDFATLDVSQSSRKYQQPLQEEPEHMDMDWEGE